jgi:hypothetical protein
LEAIRRFGRHECSKFNKNKKARRKEEKEEEEEPSRLVTPLKSVVPQFEIS